MNFKKIFAAFMTFVMAIAVFATPLAEYLPIQGDGITASAASFSIRSTAPASSNAYFYSSKNPFYSSGLSGQCTWYAFGRAYEILGSKPKLCLNDAKDWYSYNKSHGYYKYGSTPKVGAIVCWGFSPHGHVGVVEKVVSNTDVYVSEANVGTNHSFRYYHYNPKTWNSGFQGYIYLLDSVPTSTHTVDNSYPKNFTAYLKDPSSQVPVYDADHNKQSGHYISGNDPCTIIEVYTDGCCKVSYLTNSGSTRTVYTKYSYFKTTAKPDYRVNVWASNYGKDYHYNTAPELKYGTAGKYNYIWFDFYDANTGALYNGKDNFNAKITLYYPNGDVYYSHTYANSAENWIGVTPDVIGTYTMRIQLTGDWTADYQRSFEVRSDIELYLEKSNVKLTLPNNSSTSFKASLSGTVPEGAYLETDYNKNLISASISNQVLTINAKKPGTTNYILTVYDKWGNYIVSKSCTVDVYCSHTYSSWIVKEPATCNKTGYEQHTCSICGNIETRQIAATGKHTFGSWKTTKAATCTTAGTQTRTCSVCGKTETKSIAATGKHTASAAVKENVKNATCGKDGSYDEVVYCSVCGAEISRDTFTVPATGRHTFGEWKTTKDATCVATGTQTRTCLVCGGITETQTIPATGKHTFSSWKTTKPATCATAGTQTRTCSVCGKTETQTIPATGKHTASAAVKENVKNATCAKAGSYDEVVYCSVCKAQISRTTVTVPATGNHTFSSWKTTKAATCTTAGTQTRTCSVCGKTETKSIAATGKHTSSAAVKENVKNATCAKAGSYDEVVYCSVCKAQISRTTVTVPATGKHTASSAVKENVKDATCITDGSYDEVVYCSVCKAQISRTPVNVPATGKHTYVDKVVAPTYTAQGYTLHTCSVCGDSYKDSFVPKLTKAPAKVKSFGLKARGADAIQLKWAKSADADGYVVEQQSGNTWKTVKEINSAATTNCRISGLKGSTKYTWRIKAYKKVNGEKLYGETVTASYTTNPTVVAGFKLTKRADNALTFSWSKNATANGYIIEKKVGGEWVRVKKITNPETTSYTVTGLKSGTAYDIRIKSYYMAGKTALYSKTKTISARTNPSAVAGLKLKASAKDAVRLSWTKNTSADGYIVEMKVGGVWKRAGKITSNSTVEFKKSGLKSKTSYTFRIKAYKMSGKTALYSGYTTITVKTK